MPICGSSLLGAAKFTDSTPTNCVSIIPGLITSVKRTSASEDTRLYPALIAASMGPLVGAFHREWKS